MRCWICYKNIDDYVLLPETDEDENKNEKHIEKKLPAKNTYIIKKINAFTFLYYVLCFNCMEHYLKYRSLSFKNIKMREITGK